MACKTCMHIQMYSIVTGLYVSELCEDELIQKVHIVTTLNVSPIKKLTLPFPSLKPSLEGLIISLWKHTNCKDLWFTENLVKSLNVAKSESKSESESNLVQVVKLNQFKLKTKPNSTGLWPSCFSPFYAKNTSHM